MSLNLEATELLSRRIRLNSLKGIVGSGIIDIVDPPLPPTAKIRKISNLFRLRNEGTEETLIQKIWNTGGTFLNWIGGLVKGLAFSLSAAWGWLMGRIEQVKNFNWNASDAELEAMAKAQNVALAGIWGGVLGQGFGWLSGIAIGAGVGFICPVIGGASLAKMIASSTALEATDELLPAFRNALTQTAGEYANRGVLSIFLAYRSLLKQAPKEVLTLLYGEEQATWIKDKWGSKGGPDMSFNRGMDEIVENIKAPEMRAFTENFLDEAWDSFTEAGFIIARELDEALQQSKAGNTQQLGIERTVEVIPDRRNEGEKLTFVAVPQKLLMPAIQTTINTQRLVNNRDLGQLVGYPIEEYIKAKPHTRQIAIIFHERVRPPYQIIDGEKTRRSRPATYHIPDAKKGLSWAQIKAAASPFNWGKFRASANLTNGRQMQVMGATGAEAESKLRELLTLSNAEILTLSITEEKDRAVKLKKETRRLYPAYVTLLLRKETLDPSASDYSDLNGTGYSENRLKFELWSLTEPEGYRDHFQAL